MRKGINAIFRSLLRVRVAYFAGSGRGRATRTKHSPLLPPSLRFAITIPVITQRELAKRLNLSKSTVNRILIGPSAHDDKTRARVLALAAQLNYRLLRPTARKQNPRPKRSVRLGVCVETNAPSSDDIPVVHLRCLCGISEAARVEDVELDVSYLPATEAGRKALAGRQALPGRKGRTSGLLLLGGMNPALLNALSRKTPCVRICNRETDLTLDCVGQNDLDAVDALVLHLYGLNHRKIGFLSEAASSWPNWVRLAGYEMSLRCRGLELIPDAVFPPPQAGNYLPEPQKKRFERVLRQIRKGVRAWICVNDGLAGELARYLMGCGLRIPQDVSLCGFDNLEPRYPDVPKTTTIDWPFEDIGAFATRCLLRRIKAPATAPVYTMFSGRLLPGDSTGPL